MHAESLFPHLKDELHITAWWSLFFFLLTFQFTCTAWVLISLTSSNSACMVMFIADLTRAEYLRLAIFSYCIHIQTFYLTQVLIAFIAFLASHHKHLLISYIPFLHHSDNPPLLHKWQHLLTKETWGKVTLNVIRKGLSVEAVLAAALYLPSCSITLSMSEIYSEKKEVEINIHSQRLKINIVLDSSQIY